MIWYAISWILDLILIAILLGSSRKITKKIEFNQEAAFVILFLTPTIIEFLSFKIFNSPFMLIKWL